MIFKQLSYILLGLIIGVFLSIGYLNNLFFVTTKNSSKVLTTKGETQKNIKQEEKEEKDTATLKIAIGGDIMLSRGVGSRNKAEGYDRILKNFNPNTNLSDDTILFYNLESPFTKKKDNDIDYKTFIFKTNEKSIEVLNQLKGHKKMVLSLANNHIRNGGGEGIDATNDILKENNIVPVGAQQGERQSFVSLEQKGKKICFGAYTYDGGTSSMRDSAGYIKKYYVNSVNLKSIKEDIKKMKEEQCDFKVISLHWGVEYAFNPRKKQVSIAHELIDAGADLIAGGHSHILGKSEEYKGKVIYYSLGNYIFDQNWGQTVRGGNYHRVYDEKLERKTVPTYVGNTFVHEYEFQDNGTVKLINTKNIKHRIDYGAISKY